MDDICIFSKHAKKNIHHENEILSALYDAISRHVAAFAVLLPILVIF